MSDKAKECVQECKQFSQEARKEAEKMGCSEFKHVMPESGWISFGQTYFIENVEIIGFKAYNPEA